MIKRLIILIMAVMSMVTTSATARQSDREKIVGDQVRLSRVEINADTSTVAMSFLVESMKTAQNRFGFLLMPTISGSEAKVSCPPIMIQGNRAIVARSGIDSVESRSNGKMHTIRKGEKLEYTALIPAQWWMDGAEFGFETVLLDCCGGFSGGYQTVIERLELPALAEMIRTDTIITIVPRIEQFIPITVADSLSVNFSFVVPTVEFDPEDPFKFYDDERDGGMAIYFHHNNTLIDVNYQDNRQILTNLTAAVETIINSKDSHVKNVVVGGFSSPEGSFEINDRLAWERAVSIKEYVIQRTGMDNENVLLYNGSADWRGLRSMVQGSDMDTQSQIIDIIDNYPIKDDNSDNVRMDYIKKLDGGKSYRYLSENFFPKLRNGGFIKVIYENN